MRYSTLLMGIGTVPSPLIVHYDPFQVILFPQPQVLLSYTQTDLYWSKYYMESLCKYRVSFCVAPSSLVLCPAKSSHLGFLRFLAQIKETAGLCLASPNPCILGNFLQAVSWGNQRASFIRFLLPLPDAQCFRTMTSYILSGFSVVSGGRVDMVPVFPSFYNGNLLSLCFNCTSC